MLVYIGEIGEVGGMGKRWSYLDNFKVAPLESAEDGGHYCDVG